MPKGQFRRGVCRGLRCVTRRLPSLYGFNAYLRWQRRWTPADEEYRVTDVDRTITMFLRPYEFVDFALFYGAHLYEWPEQRVLWSQLTAGSTFVDVGAHIGFYTLLAAKRVGPEGRVFAFEPDPDTYARLVRNVEANPELAPRIRLFPFAASDSEGVARLYRTAPGNMGANTLATTEDAPAMPVETTTLDRIFSKEALRRERNYRQAREWLYKAVRNNPRLLADARVVVGLIIASSPRLLANSLNSLLNLAAGTPAPPIRVPPTPVVTADLRRRINKTLDVSAVRGRNSWESCR